MKLEAEESASNQWESRNRMKPRRTNNHSSDTRTPMQTWYSPWFLGYVVLLLMCIHTWDSADTFMHLNYGRLAWEQGRLIPQSPLVSQHPDAVFYWLFRLFLLGLYKVGGVVLVTLTFAGMWIGLWHNLFKATKFYSSGAKGLLWMLAALLTINYRITPRPEVVSYLMMSLYIGFILQWRWETTTMGASLFKSTAFLKKASLVAVLQIIWGGCHGYFIFGPLLFALGSLTAQTVVGLAKTSKTIWLKNFILHPLSVLSLLAFLSSLIAPTGFHQWISAYRHAFLLQELKTFIYEFASAFSWDLIGSIWILPIYCLFWFLTLGLLLWNFLKEKKLSFASAIGVIGLYLSYSSARSMPMLPLMCLPLWAHLWSAPPKDSATQKTDAFSIAVQSIAAILCIAMVTNVFYDSLTSRKKFGFGLSPTAHPVSVSDYFHQHPFSGPVFNAPETGGYLAYFNPGLKLFGDTQFTETAPSKDYIKAVSHEGFQYLNSKHHFDAAVLTITSSYDAIHGLLESKDWKIVFGDLYRVVLVRINSPYRDTLPPETPSWFKTETSFDLKEIQISYAAVLWSAIIADYYEWPMMMQFLEGIKPVANIPTTLLLNAGKVALKTNHREMSTLVARLAQARKSYSPAEESQIAKMLSQLP
jgi:hypothetical protein